MYKKRIKKVVCMVIIFAFSIVSFASLVSDNDGASYITKSEFDTLKDSFQSQINYFNRTIDSKIESAIVAYLSGVVVKGITETSLRCASNAEENWYIRVSNPGAWVDKIPRTTFTLVRTSGNYNFYDGGSLGSSSITGGVCKLFNNGELQSGIYSEESKEGSVNVAKVLGWYTWQPSSVVLALSCGNINASHPTTILSSAYPSIQIGADTENGQVSFTFALSDWTAAKEGLFVSKELETTCVKKINIFGTSNTIGIYGQVVGDRKYSTNGVNTAGWNQYSYKHGNTISTEYNNFSLVGWKESYSKTYTTISSYRNSYINEMKFSVLPTGSLTVFNPGAGFHLCQTDKKGRLTWTFKCEKTDFYWYLEASPTTYNYSSSKSSTDMLTIKNITTNTSGTRIQVKNGDFLEIEKIDNQSVFLRLIPVTSSSNYEVFYNPTDLFLHFDED